MNAKISALVISVFVITLTCKIVLQSLILTALLFLAKSTGARILWGIALLLTRSPTLPGMVIIGSIAEESKQVLQFQQL